MGTAVKQFDEGARAVRVIKMTRGAIGRLFALAALLVGALGEIDVRELTDANWDSVIDGSQHVLVEFYTQARRRPRARALSHRRARAAHA